MRAAAKALLKEQQKKYGKRVVCRASDLPPLRRVPTGSPMLDAAIGGGWPRGRISEVYGLEHSSKTSLLLITIGLAQARGEDCYYSNPECTWDPVFAKALGIRPDELPVAQPETGEDGMMQCLDAIKGEVFTVVGLDSITTFTPTQVLDKGMERTIGVEAYFNNLFVRRSVMSNRNCAFIIVNQPRVKIGGPFQLPPEPGGGQGLKHHKSVSIQLGKGGWLGADGTELGRGTRKKKAGFTVRFKIRKNKTAPPYREGSYRFYFTKWKGGGAGIDTDFDLSRLARMHGIKVAKGKKPTAAQVKKMSTWPDEED